MIKFTVKMTMGPTGMGKNEEMWGNKWKIKETMI